MRCSPFSLDSTSPGISSGSFSTAKTAPTASRRNQQQPAMRQKEEHKQTAVRHVKQAASDCRHIAASLHVPSLYIAGAPFRSLPSPPPPLALPCIFLPSVPFPSLPFPSLSFLSLPFLPSPSPSLPIPSHPFPSLPFCHLVPSAAVAESRKKEAILGTALVGPLAPAAAQRPGRQSHPEPAT